MSFLRVLRLESVLLIACGFIYLAAIRILAPLYLTQAVPLTREVYSAIGHLNLLELLWQAIELCILAALALFFFTRTRAASRLSVFLLLAGAGSFLAYLVQGTGWYYQQLPALCFFGWACALQFLERQKGVPRLPSWLPGAAATLGLVALVLTTHFTGYPFTPDRAFAIESPDPALFTALPPGTPIAILTTSVDEAMMPVERYHLTWAQRTNNLWLLPAVLRAERPEGQGARHAPSGSELLRLDTLEHRWMIEDLTRWQPRIVLVERCQVDTVRCQVLEDRHDDLLAWFKRDPAFRKLWSAYTFTKTDHRFDVYVRTL